MTKNKPKFHPILFSTPMVQAILKDRKTQTRRIIKPTPIDKNNYHFKKLEKFGSKAFGMVPNQGVEIDNINVFPYNGIWFCPYEIGDVLWVKETYIAKYYTSGKNLYRADDNNIIDASKNIGHDLGYKWTPSIFMKKVDCRLFLKIKSIKVERLYNISEEDAVAEGLVFDNQFNKYICYLCESKGHKGNINSCNDGFFSEAKASFFTLWVSINGEDSFKANPYVFVYEFEQIEKPLDFIV
jgi:hypothetical protein